MRPFVNVQDKIEGCGALAAFSASLGRMVSAQGDDCIKARLPDAAADKSWISWSMSVAIVGVMLFVLRL